MVTIGKSEKKFKWWIFILILSLGTFRCLFDLVFYPDRLVWGAWLAPRPQVFIDEHYLIEKLIAVEGSDGNTLTFNLKSEEQWPAKSELLLFHYTLVHCLDRPHLIDKEIWQKMIRFHFCKSSNSSSVIKSEILQRDVQNVKAFIRRSPSQEFKLIHEASCLD